MRFTIGPSSWTLRPQPRSRVSRPMASSRNAATAPTSMIAARITTAIQGPAIASAGLTAPTSDPAGRHQHVADPAVGDRRASLGEELERRRRAAVEREQVVESEHLGSPDAIGDPVDHLDRVPGAILLGKDFEPGALEKLAMDSRRERLADAGDRAQGSAKPAGQALDLGDHVREHQATTRDEHAPH